MGRLRVGLVALLLLTVLTGCGLTENSAASNKPPQKKMAEQVKSNITKDEFQYQSIPVSQVPIGIYPSELRPGSTKVTPYEAKTYAMIAPLYGERIEIVSVVNSNPGIDITYKVTKLAVSDYWAEAKAVVFANPVGTPVKFIRDASSLSETDNDSRAKTITYKAPAVVAGKGFVVPESVTLKVGEVREVHFTAYPEKGYFVDYWMTPKGNYSNPIISLFVGRDKQTDPSRYQIAFREPITYKITVSSSSGGVITPGPGTYSYTENDGISYQNSYSSASSEQTAALNPNTYPFTPGVYTQFEDVAKADEGYVFIGWEIRSKTFNTDNQNNILSFSLGPSTEFREVEAKAVFKKKSEVKRSTITYKVQGQGSISPGVGTYYFYPGESSSFSATPSKGWKFSYWKYYRDDKYLFKATEASGTHWPAILNQRYDWTLIAVFTKDEQ